MPAAPPLFRTEYEREMESWLRRRFALLCIIFLAIELLNLGGTAMALRVVAGEERRTLFNLIPFEIVSAIVIVGFFVTQRRIHGDRRQTLNLATGLILALGAISLAAIFLVAPATERNRVFLMFPFWHFVASLCLPWTPRESLRPMIPLIAIWTLALAVTEPAAWSLHGVGFLILMFIAAAALLLPGLAVSAWRLRRHGRLFRTRMIGQGFWSMREEFQRARSIHESMFPKPRFDDRVRFDYDYSPAAEIGGDYLHLHVAESTSGNGRGCWHMTLIDVTGHGLPAALTVNRLFGELERIRAESPNAEPAEVLTLLNRYFYLTLQRHNIYATAIAITLDPSGAEVRWCSAGHPPAFLRGMNGAVRELPATETLLGALGPEEFDAGQRSMQLAPGDVVVAYTDGVFEAANRAGEQFGLARLRKLIAVRERPSSGDYPKKIAAAVREYASGRVEDDVLVAALEFEPIQTKTRLRRKEESLITGCG